MTTTMMTNRFIFFSSLESFFAASATLPTTWQKPERNEKRFVVSPASAEYQTIKSTFDQAMGGQYTQMIKIERVQNERWYRQYMAHRQDFQQRLNMDTEKRLYHGCLDTSVQSIIDSCFNRSYAGINGKSIFSFHKKKTSFIFSN